MMVLHLVWGWLALFPPKKCLFFHGFNIHMCFIGFGLFQLKIGCISKKSLASQLEMTPACAMDDFGAPNLEYFLGNL